MPPLYQMPAHAFMGPSRPVPAERAAVLARLRQLGAEARERAENAIATERARLEGMAAAYEYAVLEVSTGRHLEARDD